MEKILMVFRRKNNFPIYSTTLVDSLLFFSLLFSYVVNIDVMIELKLERNTNENEDILTVSSFHLTSVFKLVSLPLGVFSCV